MPLLDSSCLQPQYPHGSTSTHVMNKPLTLPKTTVTSQGLFQCLKSVSECGSQTTDISQQDPGLPSSHPSDTNKTETKTEQPLANEKQKVPLFDGRPLSKPEEETRDPTQTVKSAPCRIDSRKEKEDRMILCQKLLTDSLFDEHADLRKVETQLAHATEENQTLHQKVDKLEKEKAALKEDLDSITEKFYQVQEENLSLHQKVSELKKAMAELQEKHTVMADNESLEKKISALTTGED